MSDEELRHLELRSKSGDPQAWEQFQATRARLGLTSDDAEYLEKYVALCEEFVSGTINLYDAQGGTPWDDYDDEDLEEEELETKKQPKVGRLQQLNEEYKYRIHPKTRRDHIMASFLASYEDSDGWAISAIC